ncbi:hypothetical protein DFA_03894 [Cavenderia fasciculata]|uniref:PIF1/LRR1 pleckstrin homology domain-containing protein n=1 Tax=Cavenderia fasciculata TaxID=261658 RepID=F4Q0P9_CACFS|nr:uncharacterized protein DFA_03894 [Cavenderia fasciculata]EGG18400.1 hypothetical protein DFA_03894 [Cavenderia fasciculata]|eukprot:XP_004366304.1 hypothetical protein DFA_03894 [Cavenderia fasciculata]
MAIEVECNTVVDFLQQQRKSTKPNTKGFILKRDPNTLQICMVVGQHVFKIEESLSKIYSGMVNQGKCTLELRMSGGTTANVLISNANVEKLQSVVQILNSILEAPQNSLDIDLQEEEEEEEEEEGKGGGDD